jgi:hypothetical protein
MDTLIFPHYSERFVVVTLQLIILSKHLDFHISKLFVH